MADRNAIAELFARYAYGMDSGHNQITTDVFAPDATLSVDIAGTPAIGPIEGGQAIGAFIKDVTTYEPGIQSRHVITNLILTDEAAESATAVAYLTMSLTENGRLRPQITGLYTAEAVRLGGTWKIRRMHLTQDSGIASDVAPSWARRGMSH